MLYIQLHQGGLSHPVSVLEEYFRSAGVTVVQAAFAHSYFIHSASVKAKTPYFSDRARFSRQNYPGATKGQKAVWAGDGREVVIDDNQHAQMAWERVHWSRACPRNRLLRSPHMGAPVGPGCLHSRVEPLLHALLGRNADGRAAPPRGT